ncbi:MAG: type II secretion system minor pseudopilin GspI [Pseudomonadota bacterium]
MTERDTFAHASGFTLVEVLAALAIFSIAALALVRVSAENTRTAQMVETRALASIVADNQIADVMTRTEPLELGVRTDGLELAGRLWQVRETIRRSPNPLIHELVVEVAIVDTDQELRTILNMAAFLPAAGVS